MFLVYCHRTRYCLGGYGVLSISSLQIEGKKVLSKMKVEIGVTCTCMLFFLILAEETCDSELDDDCQVKKKDRKDKYSKGSFEVGRKVCFKLNNANVYPIF